MRHRAAALAMLAVLFLLARPICAAQDMRAPVPHAAAEATLQGLPQAPHHPADCCDVVKTSVIAAPSPLAALPAAAAPAVYAIVRTPARILPAPTAGGAPPPPPLSYHARSARIRR